MWCFAIDRTDILGQHSFLCGDCRSYRKSFFEGPLMGQLGVGVAMKLKDVRRPIPVGERVGVDFPRFFTAQTEGKTAYDEVVWELRTPSIGNDKGVAISEQRDAEVRGAWPE